MGLARFHNIYSQLNTITSTWNLSVWRGVRRETSDLSCAVIPHKIGSCSSWSQYGGLCALSSFLTSRAKWRLW
ncbi:hypothetical protein CRM22_007077 [Opisthorchis felineus]|uniref:Uncharacterized protein n=1 Tax=Opisthorchis felineus TaxID=147828 RepID=A0A4S2LQW0_OPIFE|nr:hypothetical protein CRM22_007077 [Opisthorchis felineus]